MEDGITVSMPGARDLIAELKELKEDIRYRTVRAAIRDAGAFVLTKLRANTPVDTGKLRDNLRVLTRWKSRRGIMQAKVLVNTQGKAKDPKNAFYWRFVEFGHRVGTRKTGYLRKFDRPGSSRPEGVGHVEAEKFILKTLQETQQAVTQRFFTHLENALRRRQGRTLH